MKKTLLAILSVFLLVGGVFAENTPAKTAKAENPADFACL
jgi:hypothetical protein